MMEELKAMDMDADPEGALQNFPVLYARVPLRIPTMSIESARSCKDARSFWKGAAGSA
ncbi:MAG: hypothetical protein ACLU3U_09020 [Gallintestinimicrobium sp.]